MATTTGKLPGDSCDNDWIWDREVETASPAEVRRMADVQWREQLRHLREHSSFYRTRLGAGHVELDDLDRLPFTTKAELKDATAASPPFGDNLAVPERAVKRVYQTSGSTGAPSVIA